MSKSFKITLAFIIAEMVIIICAFDYWLLIHKAIVTVTLLALAFAYVYGAVRAIRLTMKNRRSDLWMLGSD